MTRIGTKMIKPKYTTEELRAELNDIIEDGIIAIKNMHSGDSYRLKDVTETELIIFVNHMQQALIEEIEKRLPEKYDYLTRKHETKWDPKSCGIRNETIDRVTETLEAIKMEIV